MSKLTYSEVILELESLGIMPDKAPSLGPVQEGLRMILPEGILDPSRVIVVAGTNGKGSVCATLEALFLAAGKTVGLYISPHLEETTERIRINGNDITALSFCVAYEKTLEKIGTLKLSHFEMLTLMAVWVFCVQENNRLDWLIFEVGLGGTWDATNAIPHHFNVITSLGYDHQNLLGETLPEIALNKFGIVTQNSTVVYTPLPEEVKSLAQQISTTTQSRWIESIPFTLKVVKTEAEPVFILQTIWGEAPLTLAGHRACQNSATALTLFHELGFDPALFLSALSRVRWPGRMERVQNLKTICPIYLSGDHNPQGIQSLLEILPNYSRKHLFILVGVGKDKDLEGILAPLFSLSDTSVFLTETPFRGRPLPAYENWLSRSQGSWPNPTQALQKVLALAKSEDLVLVTGSLYLVGFLKHELRAMTIL